jgi:hypothetical protein
MASAQPRAAQEASMQPKEGTRQVTELGEVAEKRARWRRSGGGRGGSSSGEGVAQRDQHMAQGGVVVHRDVLRLTGWRGKRTEHNAH